MSGETTPQWQLLIYSDGALNLQVRLGGQTVWLTQAAMAELFQTTKQKVSLHIQNILSDKELASEAVVKEYLTTAGADYFDELLARIRDIRASERLFYQKIRTFTPPASTTMPTSS